VGFLVITDALHYFTAVPITERFALLALILAVGIMAQQVLGRTRPTILPSETDALRAQLHMMNDRANAAEHDLQRLAQMLDALPGPIWRLDEQGDLEWANRFYHTLSAADLNLLETVAPNSIATLPGPPPQALEIGEGKNEAAAQIYYGLPADRLLNTQAALHRFVETLTQTFAHLPIGLAIFDRDRRLSLFNPALSDLLALDPSWLAARPNFRAVMERLRASGRMPDRADFQSWLQHLQSMEETAASTGYQEAWLLSGGQNLRVTGRPHPDGALAFIFEDMTHLSHVESRHRTEIALNQAILDRMAEAVAVFDTSGALVFANEPFDSLWQIDSATTLLAPDIHALVARWSALGGAQADWDALRKHVSGGAERQSGQTLLDVPGQGAMLCLWATLPDGSALVYFKTPPKPTGWPKLIAPLAQALAPGHILDEGATAQGDGAEDERAVLRATINQLIHQSAHQRDTAKSAEMVG